jgi:hypothetical protein
VLFFAINLLSQDLNLTRLDQVHQVAGISLPEEKLPLVEHDLCGFSLGRRKVGSQLDDLVGELCDALVVRGHYDHPAGTGQIPQQPQDSFDLDVIQVSRGLIGQYQRRIMHQGAGDGRPLLLPTRHMGRPVTGPLGEADAVQQGGGPLTGLLAGDARQAQRNHHIGPGAETGDEVEGLEHHADGLAAIGGQGLAVQSGDFFVVEADRARGRCEQTRQAGEQCGLAAAGRSEQHHQLAVAAVERETVERMDLVTAGREFHGEILDGQGHGITHRTPRPDQRR